MAAKDEAEAWAYITLPGWLARRCYWFPRRFLYEAIHLSDLLLGLIQRNVPGTYLGMGEVLKLILDVCIESRRLIWFRPQVGLSFEPPSSNEGVFLRSGGDIYPLGCPRIATIRIA